jgi:hypothetical protein
MKRFLGLPFRPGLPPRRRWGLNLERLEARDVPSATLFVVPLSTPADNTHYHDLASAVAAAAAKDTIQVEPLSNPGESVFVDKPVTIQGDPASSPATLPPLGPSPPGVTITASKVTLINLNLSSVTIDHRVNQTTIASCLVGQVEDLGGSGSGYTKLLNNVITSGVLLSGNTSGATNDLVEGNVFTPQSSAGFFYPLALINANGTVVQGNTITGLAYAYDGGGIEVNDSTGVLIRNNTVRMAAPYSAGIVVNDPHLATAGVATSVTIADNVVQSGSYGQYTGIAVFKNYTNSPLSVALSGNDVVNNKIGVSITGDGTSFGTVDLGGGSLGSSGNNDFRLFTGTLGRFAIQALGAPGDTIQAQNNLFTGSPAAAIAAPGATVNATSQSANAAFIQRLYEDYLHRAASTSEVAVWLPMLVNGRQAVINSIAHSEEAEILLVDGLYHRLLGRTALGDSGAWGWIKGLEKGTTEEQVITGIASTPEFYSRANGLVSSGTPDQRFVISLYHLVLGRQADPSSAEVAGWVGQLPSIGRAGVVQKLLASSEYRQQAVTALYFADPTVVSTAAYPSIPGQWVGSTLPDLLHRSGPPTMAELNGWVGSSLDVLSIEARMAATDEFFSNG